MNRSKFFCAPRLTRWGLQAQALRNFAKSVLVIFRENGMSRFNFFSFAGVVPSRASMVL